MVENSFLNDLRLANERKLLEASIENVQANCVIIYASIVIWIKNGGKYKIHLIWKVENTEICTLIFVTIIRNEMTNKTCTEVAS